MNSSSPSDQMKILKIIHFVLIIGPSFFALVTIYVLSSKGEVAWMDEEDILTYLPVGMAIVVIPLASSIFSKFLKQNVNNEMTLKDKLAAYQTANIIRMGMIEGVGLFAIVVCFVTVTWLNMITFGILLSIMILSVPSVFKVSEKLQLTRDEESQLIGEGL